MDAWLLENMEKVAMEFFMLPLEEKEKYPMVPGTFQGYGHAFVVSEEQKLDWSNMFALGIQPLSIRDPKFWPTRPADFRYVGTLQRATHGLSRVMYKISSSTPPLMQTNGR